MVYITQKNISVNFFVMVIHTVHILFFSIMCKKIFMKMAIPDSSKVSSIPRMLPSLLWRVTMISWVMWPLQCPPSCRTWCHNWPGPSSCVSSQSPGSGTGRRWTPWSCPATPSWSTRRVPQMMCGGGAPSGALGCDLTRNKILNHFGLFPFIFYIPPILKFNVQC